jgi:hypothetical protein
MRSHNGLRPQDIAILLKIISLGAKDRYWQFRDLYASLSISISETSESLSRSEQAGLINGKRVARNSLMEFIQYGLKYVFPQKPGPIATGMPTAYSHPFFKERIIIINQQYE